MTSAESERAAVVAWQPIETAPKDGSRVLLWTDTRTAPDLDSYLAMMGGEHFAEVQIGYFEAGEWELPRIGEPLLWMPLPPPPGDHLKGQSDG